MYGNPQMRPTVFSVMMRWKWYSTSPSNSFAGEGWVKPHGKPFDGTGAWWPTTTFSDPGDLVNGGI